MAQTRWGVKKGLKIAFQFHSTVDAPTSRLRDSIIAPQEKSKNSLGFGVVILACA